jgi:hypothetical protein
MGNRANIVFRQENGYLGVYLHSMDANHTQEVAAQALDRVMKAGREDDETYGTRIAVSEIIGGGWDSNYGFGLQAGKTISEAVGDNENDVVVIDFTECVVMVFGFETGEIEIGGEKERSTFETFIKTWRAKA